MFKPLAILFTLSFSLSLWAQPVHIECALNTYSDFIRAGPNRLTLIIDADQAGIYHADFDEQGEKYSFIIQEKLNPETLLSGTPQTMTSRDGFRLELENFLHDIERSCRPGYDCREIWYSASMTVPTPSGVKFQFFRSEDHSSFCEVNRAFVKKD